MWKRLFVSVTVVATGIGADASAQTPAQIVGTSSYGLGTVSISSTSDGVDADIGAWSGNPNVYPNEPFGCQFLYVDINVNDGGTLSFKYNQRSWGGLWFPPGAGSSDEDWLDVYLLTPGTTWDPGTTWSQDGSERCFRQDWPSGVLPLIEDFDFRDYSTTCANGTTSCIRESPDLEFTVSLNQWAHQSVRVVFRQWVEGSGDETQTRVRNLDVRDCPVTPLAPIGTDPDTLSFEDGNTLDLTRLVANMQTARVCLQNAVINQGGTFPSNAISSAWRPADYQRHFREVWDKWKVLKNNRKAECANRKEEVRIEVEKHDIDTLQWQPAGPNGPHVQGRALDLNYAATGLMEAVVVQLADSCDLIRPNAQKDHVHFIHR